MATAAVPKPSTETAAAFVAGAKVARTTAAIINSRKGSIFIIMAFALQNNFLTGWHAYERSGLACKLVCFCKFGCSRRLGERGTCSVDTLLAHALKALQLTTFLQHHQKLTRQGKST
ncbi:hypothetical protein [Paracoccus fontiphilus]|uniref:hypothetical protein n=1 Tax=Paracoccus fontiphilus TaxID=1815556 RepID=UPI00366DE3A1